MAGLQMLQHLLEVELVDQGAADRAYAVVIVGRLQQCDGIAALRHGTVTLYGNEKAASWETGGLSMSAGSELWGGDPAWGVRLNTTEMHRPLQTIRGIDGIDGVSPVK